MKTKNRILTVGFLSLMGGAVVLSASNSFAAGAQRVDVIDNLPMGGQSDGTNTAESKTQRVDVIDSLPTEAQWDSTNNAGHQVRRVDVIDSLESQGPVYPSTSGAMRVDVIERTRS